MTDRYTDASVSSGEELRIGMLGTANQATQNIKNSYAVYCTYDEVNALTEVQSDDGMVASYVYNADGRRIQKTVNGVTTTHMWERDCIIGEKNANGDIMATYYRAAHLVASKQGDTVSTYSYDPHGSVVDFGGTSYQYDAFGNQLTDTTADNPFRYCGEYFDSETGFIYLRNRYYDTVTGRFITEDPVKDGLNWYVYCGNNPIMFVDPSGYLRAPGFNSQGVWSDNPDRDDYGENSKVYIALCRLTEAYEVFPEYHSVISELANEVRWIGNEWGSSKIDEDVAEILEMKQAQSLNTVEQVLAAAYKKEAAMVQVSREVSDLLTMVLYNEKGNGTNEANAFKHIYWSAYATSEIGGTYVKLFTNAHEFGWYDQNLNDPEAMKMDLHNNQRGRYLGSLDSRLDLITIVVNDIANGNAAILVDGKSVLNGR